MTVGSLLGNPGPSWLKTLTALAERQRGHTFILDAEETKRRAAELDAVVGSWGNSEFLAGATSLKALFLTFAGVNNLPLDLLASRKVTVCNCHANAESVAERAIALTLALAGRIVPFHNGLSRGNWHAGKPRESANDTWISLREKKCSVFGMGSIGTGIAKLLKAFGCEVTGFRRDASAEKPEWFDHVESDFKAAVDSCDFALVALPLTTETKGIFSKEVLGAMKGKYITNVGRGELLDEEGLWNSLEDGTLAGAAIDTWYTYPGKGIEECFPSRFPVHTLPNVVLSPHISGASDIASEATIHDTSGNIETWLRTGTCHKTVDLKKGY